jgi:hypothetical protein
MAQTLLQSPPIGLPWVGSLYLVSEYANGTSMCAEETLTTIKKALNPKE